VNIRGLIIVFFVATLYDYEYAHDYACEWECECGWKKEMKKFLFVWFGELGIKLVEFVGKEKRDFKLFSIYFNAEFAENYVKRSRS